MRDHHSQQLFRAIHGYFANFSRSVGSISEEIYSQQAVYLSYTSIQSFAISTNGTIGQGKPLKISGTVAGRYDAVEEGYPDASDVSNLDTPNVIRSGNFSIEDGKIVQSIAGDAQVAGFSSDTSPAYVNLACAAALSDFQSYFEMRLRGRNDAGEDTTFTRIRALAFDVSDSTEDGSLLFDTMVAGTLLTAVTLRNQIGVVGNATVGSTYNQAGSWGVRRLYFDGGPFDSAGSGSPEGVVTAPIGSIYRRADGGASTTFYVKESGSGNTGWVAK